MNRRFSSPGRRVGTAAAAVVVLGAAAAPLFACSLLPLFWVRDEAQPALVLEALRDSVYVGTFIPERYDPQTDSVSLDHASAKRVYGQVLRVREVVARGAGLPAEVRPGAQVVVIDWGLSASCGVDAPYQAYTAPPGQLAFVLPMRRSLPVSGAWVQARGASAPALPVLQLSAHERSYVPAYQYRGLKRIYRLLRPRPMTVEEYARMYRAMPGRQEWLRDPHAAARRVARWGQANPGLARREPARMMVEYLDYTAGRMEDEAKEQQAR